MIWAVFNSLVEGRKSLESGPNSRKTFSVHIFIIVDGIDSLIGALQVSETQVDFFHSCKKNPKIISLRRCLNSGLPSGGGKDYIGTGVCHRPSEIDRSRTLPV